MIVIWFSQIDLDSLISKSYWFNSSKQKQCVKMSHLCIEQCAKDSNKMRANVNTCCRLKYDIGKKPFRYENEHC